MRFNYGNFYINKKRDIINIIFCDIQFIGLLKGKIELSWDRYHHNGDYRQFWYRITAKWNMNLQCEHLKKKPSYGIFKVYHRCTVNTAFLSFSIVNTH